MALLDNLEHEYLFNDSDGTDTIGSGDLTANGTVTFSDGPAGFGKEVSAPSGGTLDKTSGLDSTWYPSTNWSVAFTLDDNDSLFWIATWDDSTWGGPNKMSLFTASSGTALWIQGLGVNTSRTISASTRQDIAITFNSGTVKMYSDGSQLGADITGVSEFSGITRFGLLRDGSNVNAASTKIDSFRIWSKTLSPSEVSELASLTSESLVPSYTDSGSSTIGELATALSNNVAKYTHPDGYDFYVRDGAAGREGYSKAGTNVYLVDVVYNANSDAGQKYVASSTALNTLLRLNGEDPNLMYEVTGNEETIATAYLKDSAGDLNSLGKMKVKEITLVNQTDVSYPLVLPLVAP